MVVFQFRLRASKVGRGQLKLTILSLSLSRVRVEPFGLDRAMSQPELFMFNISLRTLHGARTLHRALQMESYLSGFLRLNLSQRTQQSQYLCLLRELLWSSSSYLSSKELEQPIRKFKSVDAQRCFSCTV